MTERTENLKELGRPIVEYLKEKHPYCYIVVSSDGIHLVEITERVPFTEE